MIERLEEIIRKYNSFIDNNHPSLADKSRAGDG